MDPKTCPADEHDWHRVARDIQLCSGCGAHQWLCFGVDPGPVLIDESDPVVIRYRRAERECPDGQLHEWRYLGEHSELQICDRCKACGVAARS